MELSAREDIEAPIDWVWREVTDQATFERLAARRGAAMRRTDGGERFGVGAAWTLTFTARGAERTLDLTVVEADPPARWIADVVSGEIGGRLVLDLVELSPDRTRLALQAEMTARSLSGRLLLQPMKLARAEILRRFRDRVADFGADLERRHRAGQ